MIIVILASVTITATFGENGIIRQAELARDLALNSTIAEAEDMNAMVDEYSNIISEGENPGPGPEGDKTPPIVEITTEEITETSIAITVNATDDSGEIASYKYYLNDVEQKIDIADTYTFDGLTAETEYTIKVEAFDKVGNKGEKTITASTTKKQTIGDIVGGDRVENNTEIEDDLGNKVWIPGEFGVAPDSGTKVEEGIVIEDANGNQFVWIPVGEYKVSTSINATGKLTNELSRRSWGAQNVVQDPMTATNDNVIVSYFYGEGNGNSVASGTIGTFKNRATTKGGFYIGRYEQGTNNVCKKNIEPYIDITRNQAKEQAEAMYSNNSHVKSELISSYARDTALNFICQTNPKDTSGDLLGCKLATTANRNYGNIGTKTPTKTGSYKVSGKEADKYSNIYDFLGNRLEWTTEYSNYSNDIDYPCVFRGGSYYASNTYASYRGFSSVGNRTDTIGFRLQVYVK